jgi:predicted nucleic-acid-binding protein
MGDDPPKATRAAALMQRVERNEEAVAISKEVLTETVWTLESYYEVPRRETAEKLTSVLNLAGVRTGAREVLLEALHLYAHSSADFVDCMLAARSRDTGLPVYTFDEIDFKRLNVPWQKP